MWYRSGLPRKTVAINTYAHKVAELRAAIPATVCSSTECNIFSVILHPIMFLHKLNSLRLRMVQVFFFQVANGIWCTHTALMYCFGYYQVLTVNNYVDNINYKYYVTMAMSPSTINMAQTWEVFDEMWKGWSTSFIVTWGYLCKMVYSI